MSHTTTFLWISFRINLKCLLLGSSFMKSFLYPMINPSPTNVHCRFLLFLYLKWNYWKLAWLENCYFWKETHLYIYSSWLRYFILAFVSYLNILSNRFQSHFSFSAASYYCINHNDCFPAYTNACWFSKFKLLPGLSFFCNHYTFLWWISRDVHDCFQASCFFQTKGSLFLSCLGIYCASIHFENSNITSAIICLDSSYILCDWI